MNALINDNYINNEVKENNSNNKHHQKKRVQLLSVDGGGVRCIIPLRILKEITKRTGLAVHEIFDGFAGTSAGAFLLNALLIPGENNGAKFTPSILWKRLDDDLPKIFNETLSRELEGGFGLFESKYSAKPLRESVTELVDQALFKDQIAEILVPSFNKNTYEPIIFTREESRKDNEKSALKVYDVILASTAAPTYFPPHKMEMGGNEYSCVDGGLVANNPSAFCYAQAKKSGHKNKKILLVSLGTGLPDYSTHKSLGTGLLGWLPNIEDAFFMGAEKGADELTKRLVKKYYRINVPIKASHNKLDDASKENLHYLKKAAKKWIKKNDDYIESLCKKLTKGRI